MAADSDITRTKIETYLPAYQKEHWQEHAKDLDMTQSEFIRSMVQAGRRGFGTEEADDGNRTSDASGESVEGRSTDATPGGAGLEKRVLSILDDGPCSWEELVAQITEDVEERLDGTLERLQESNRIRYSGRNGGYTRTEDD